MEATHIIHPIEGMKSEPANNVGARGKYVSCSTDFYELEVFSGQTCETEEVAVASWNEIFSKAPIMYNADGEAV